MNFITVTIAILLAILKLPGTLQQNWTERQLQTQFVLNISLALHKLYNFDNLITYRIARPRRNNAFILKSWYNHNITLDEPGVNFARIMTQQNIYVPLMTFSIDSKLDVIDTASIPNLGQILVNKNLAIVILPDVFNEKLMSFVSISLGASQETKIVFVYTDVGLSSLGDSDRKKKLREFFRWCWSKNILNAILVFKIPRMPNVPDFIMDVYTYTPFPKPIKLVHLTSQHVATYFAEKTVNLMGYKFKSPVFQDKPIVFKTLDKKTGKEIITGTAGRLFLEFVKTLNATFVEIPSSHIKNPRDRIYFVFDHVRKGEVDIGIHPYSYLIPYNISGSFPITHTNSCVVVPVRPEIKRAYYIPHTFNAKMWKYMALTFVLFYALHMATNYQRFRKFEASIAFAVTLSGLLNLPSSFSHHHRRTGCQWNNFFGNKIAAFTKILLMTTGLISTHSYLATLTSLLSTTMYGPQIETLDDLCSANISIMLLDHVALFYKYLDIFPPSFDTNLLLTDAETLARHQFQLNNHYAYVVYQEEWKVMRRLQTNLWKPVFRIASKLCISNLYLAFPMKYKSPFEKRLKRFILWTHATGLDAKWSDKVFSEIQQEWRTLLRWRFHPVPITITHLTVAGYILGLGLLLASAVFSAELLSKKNNLRCRKRD